MQPGDKVVLHNGTYRESVKISRSGTREKPIRFEAAPGARVVISGADQLTNWKKVADSGDDNVFVTDWDYRFVKWSPTMTHPDAEYHLLIGRAEQVAVNGYFLRQVLGRDKVTRGTFFADTENKKLYIQTSDNAADIAKAPPWAPRVEAATRESIWDCSADWVTVRGVRFSMAAAAAQNGMAQFSGRFDRVEDCTFENSNGVGAHFKGEDTAVLHLRR